jgi:Fe2+ or Zn2+ uptake regulation protein
MNKKDTSKKDSKTSEKDGKKRTNRGGEQGTTSALPPETERKPERGREVRKVRELREVREVKLSARRRLVYETLKEHDHLDAYEVHALVREKDARISLATVYRALAQLKRSGLVIERSFGENHAHFEAVGRTGGDHAHLVCTKCGRVVELELRDRDVYVSAAEEEDFSVDAIHTDIYGLCSSCQ